MRVLTGTLDVYDNEVLRITIDTSKRKQYLIIAKLFR